ncbi:hypothetical protein C6V83_06115 [Gordonia iterans]|uniref:Uncharacterized protein n=1 Tax=Gordonia iterans TaxID=1004901 RepID=A0A2S0KE08_9ACTN|nr:hypothetical protein C6V83_06115 [Gordonia iterans]
MARLARENIALLLTGGDAPGAFSAELSAFAAGLALSVDGVGPVKLPIAPRRVGSCNTSR